MSVCLEGKVFIAKGVREAESLVLTSVIIHDKQGMPHRVLSMGLGVVNGEKIGTRFVYIRKGGVGRDSRNYGMEEFEGFMEKITDKGGDVIVIFLVPNNKREFDNQNEHLRGVNWLWEQMGVDFETEEIGEENKNLLDQIYYGPIPEEFPVFPSIAIMFSEYSEDE